MRLYLETQQWVQGTEIGRKSYKGFVDGVLGDTKRLVGALDQAADKLKLLGPISHAGNVQLAADLQKLTQNANSLDTKLDALTNSAAATDARIGSLARETSGFNTRLFESDQRIARLVTDVDKLTAGVSKLDDKVDKAGNELREYARNADRAGESTRRFRRDAEGEFGNITKAARDMRNMLGGLGLGVGAGMIVAGNQRSSAFLDKSLIQLRQTAGATPEQANSLRDDLWALGRRTGQMPESLREATNSLVQSGLDWNASIASTRSINTANAITGADGRVLADGLTVGSRIFGQDLAKDGVATGMLERMTVAGRLGNAELEDLSAIFSRVGPNAKASNLNFTGTLGFIETLSQLEKNPERLGTLADSTLRIFTNDNYRMTAAKATGVNFYQGGTASNPSGNARDPMDTLSEVAAMYQKLTTDRQRDVYVSKAFGQTDLDTIRGLRTMLDGNTVNQWREMSRLIEGASGTFAREINDSLDNAADQGSRLKIVMREVGDAFARPINKAFADTMDFALRPKSQGGMELSDGEVIAGTAAAVLGAGAIGMLGKQIGGKSKGMLGKLLGNSASTAAGVAQGKLLESVAGVTPVYVTNAGEIGSGVSAGVLGMPGGKGGKGLSPQNPMGLLGPGAAFIGGYAVGSYIWDKIDTTPFADKLGGTIATVLAKFGNDDAADAIERTVGSKPNSLWGDVSELIGGMQSRWDASVSSSGLNLDSAIKSALDESRSMTLADLSKLIELNGRIEIVVDDQRVRVKSIKTNQPGVDLDAHSGMIGATP